MVLFPDGMFQTETRVSFSKAIFDASFRISRPFFGKLMKLICANSRHDSGQINQVWILHTIYPNREQTSLPI